MRSAVFGFEQHGREDPWEGAPAWAIELAWRIDDVRQRVDRARAEIKDIDRRIPHLQITADIGHDVVTEQPEPTCPGP